MAKIKKPVFLPTSSKVSELAGDEGFEPPIIPLQKDCFTDSRLNRSANAQYCGSGENRTHSAEALVLQTSPTLQRWRTPLAVLEGIEPSFYLT